MEHGLVFVVREAYVLEHQMPLDTRHGLGASRIIVLGGPGEELRSPIETSECLRHLCSDVGHLHDGRDQKSHNKRERDKIAQRHGPRQNLPAPITHDEHARGPDEKGAEARDPARCGQRLFDVLEDAKHPGFEDSPSFSIA